MPSKIKKTNEEELLGEEVNEEDLLGEPVNDELLGEEIKDEPIDPLGGKTPIAKSAILGLGKGLTLGWGDEIAGGIAAGVDKLKGSKLPYDQLRSEYTGLQRNIDAKSEKENPYTSGAANLVGAGVNPLSRLGGNFVGGVVSGGIGGAGEADKDKVEGAVTGGAVGGVIGGATAGMSKLYKYLKDYKLHGFQAATGDSTKAYKAASKAGKIDSRADDLLARTPELKREGAAKSVIGFTTDIEDIANRAEIKRHLFGKKIGEVGLAIDKKGLGFVDANAIAERISKYATELSDAPISDKIKKKLYKEFSHYIDRGRISFAEAAKDKMSYVYNPKLLEKNRFPSDVTNVINRAISDEMEIAAKKAAAKATDKETKELISNYVKYKGQYDSFRNAAETAGEEVIKKKTTPLISGSNLLNVSGVAAAIPAIATGGMSGWAATAAILGGIASYNIKNKGRSALAKSGYELNKVLNLAPKVAQKYGGRIVDAVKQGLPFEAIHESLKSEYPDYKQASEE